MRSVEQASREDNAHRSRVRVTSCDQEYLVARQVRERRLARSIRPFHCDGRASCEGGAAAGRGEVDVGEGQGKGRSEGEEPEPHAGQNDWKMTLRGGGLAAESAALMKPGASDGS